MPDLSSKASHRYWFEYPDPMIYKVVAFMEGVESWTLDGDKHLEEAVVKLGQALEEVGNIQLKKEDDLIQLAAYIKFARTLRLLQCLDTANPGSASKLLAYAEEQAASQEDVAGLFLRRNIIFERLRLLGRVFSKDRLATVVKALEEAYHD